MSISFADAERIVNKRLENTSKISGIELMIMERAIIEKQFYWVFFYNSKSFLETGDLSFALAGNSPIIIDKIRGEIFETGTAHPIEFYMDEFERKHFHY